MSDPHAPYIKQLTDRGDWAALLRYWIAHSLHQPAVEAALDIVRSINQPVLLGWLEQRSAAPKELTDEQPIFDTLTKEEEASIFIVRQFCVIALFQASRGEHRVQIYPAWQNAIEGFVNVARDLGDEALYAAAHLTAGDALAVEASSQRSIPAYEEALATYIRLSDSSPTIYQPYVAMTANSLGGALTANSLFEAAAEQFAKSSQVYRDLADLDEDEYLSPLAQTLNNMGAVHLNMGRADIAIHDFTKAEKIFHDLASADFRHLPELGAIRNSLGNALADLNQNDEAIEKYKKAIEVLRPVAELCPNLHLGSLGDTINNLGTVLADDHQLQDAASALRTAFSFYQILATSDPARFLPRAARVLYNLGNVLEGLDELPEAAEAYVESLRIYDELAPYIGNAEITDRLNLFRNYAGLVLREDVSIGWPDRPLARRLLQRACDLAEQFRGLFGSPQERVRVQEEMLSIYHLRTQVCTDCGWLQNDRTGFTEALEAAEGSRSRNLLDMLAEVLVPENAPQELQEQFRTLHRSLRHAQRRLHLEFETTESLAKLQHNAPDDGTPDSEPEPIDGKNSDGKGGEQPRGSISSGSRAETKGLPDTERRLRHPLRLAQDVSAQTSQKLKLQKTVEYINEQLKPYSEVIAQLQHADPDFRPDAASPSFRMDDLPSLFPTDKPTFYVHLEILSEVCHASVLTPTDLLPVSLTDLPSKKIVELVHRLSAAQSGTPDGSNSGRLNVVLPQVLAELQTALLKPLLPVLDNAGLQPGNRVVFVPDGVLNFLPLHALQLPDGSALGETYEVGYTLSLSILLHCQRRKRPEPTRLFGIVNPTKDKELPHTSAEAAMARQTFTDCRIEVSTSRQEFLANASYAHVLYWMGHAQFSVSVPYWSGLIHQLTGLRAVKDENGEDANETFVQMPDDVITFTDIDSTLQMDECWLAVLAGCQSGLALTGKGNETISLVSAFLHAGAKCVLASLWPVNDRSCMLTMARFMQAWRSEGQCVGQALQTAQQWLRNLTAAELVEWYDTFTDPDMVDQVMRLKWWAQEEVKEHAADHQPFADPYHWAPFVAVGQTWKDDAIAK